MAVAVDVVSEVFMVCWIAQEFVVYEGGLGEIYNTHVSGTGDQTPGSVCLGACCSMAVSSRRLAGSKQVEVIASIKRFGV